MARHPQSDKTAFGVPELLSDSGSSLGSMLRHARLLRRLQARLAEFLDPELAAHFQVANIRQNRLVLIAPSAAWVTRLRMQAPEALRSLQQAGYPEIESIDVRVAPLAEIRSDSRRRRPLTPAARRALDQMERLTAADDEDPDNRPVDRRDRRS
jgi:hypothetical protein